MVTLGNNDDESEGNSPVQKGAGKKSRRSEDRRTLSIRSWMAVLVSFELELQKLESELQDCRKAKEECKMELLKVELQLEDKTQLVRDVEEKFARLKSDILVANTELVALRFNFPSYSDLVEANVREIEVLHRKRDAQQGMVKAFRSLQDVANVDHSRILESISTARDAWENVL